MSDAPVDVATLRARHEGDEAWIIREQRTPGWLLIHQDRGALLAALDRVDAITVDEIAQVIAETRGPHPSGVATIWHGLPWGETSPANQATYRAMATAVLTLLRARVPGAG